MVPKTLHSHCTDLDTFWSAEKQRVEAHLVEWLRTPAGASERLYAAMRHSVLAPGKRLRPILCLATYTAARGDDSIRIYPVAAALEMIHTYSLIHDDLPCMDDDVQRRGRPTVHVAFDEATAVLAGDALQALAFSLLGMHAPSNVVTLVASSVGPEGMAGGQMADLEAENAEPTEELVEGIHKAKTGRLITASVLTGAYMTGLSVFRTRGTTALKKYGECIGLAFQIMDDVLELTESSEILGKPTNSDLKHKKVTYPAAVGLERAKTRARELSEEAKTHLLQADFPGDRSLLLAMADFIVSRDR